MNFIGQADLEATWDAILPAWGNHSILDDDLKTRLVSLYNTLTEWENRNDAED